MIHLSHIPSRLAVAAFFSFSALGQADDVELTGKPYIDMNYGPYLSASIEVAPGNIAYKGIAIRLDEGPGGVSKGSEFVVFDTDTLRMAAAWSGDGFIDWRSIVYDGSHGTHPKLVGKRLFTNPVAPGWARPGTNRFEDPRLRGLDNKPYGPLPRDWGHYRGLYVNGNRVVLSYTVGTRGVFESPELHGKNIVIRNLQIEPGTSEIVMQVAHGESGATHLTGNKDIVFVKAAQAVVSVSPTGQIDFGSSDTTLTAWIKTKAGGTIISKAAASGQWVPNGKTFFVRDGRLGYDVGWVGMVESRQSVNDGKWHHVAAKRTRAGRVTLFIDGKRVASGTLASQDAANHIVRLGYTATDFMPSFNGEMDEVRIFRRALSSKELASLAAGKGPDDTVAHWSFDGVKGAKIPNAKGISYTGTNRGARLVKGKTGQALQFNGNAQVLISGKAKGKAPAPKDLAANDPIIAATVLGGSGHWDLADDANLRLRIPAADKGLKLQMLVWNGKHSEMEGFEKAIAAVNQTGNRPNLLALIDGGPAQWEQTVDTGIRPGPATGPFGTDTFQLPDENPYRSWMRLGGFDFFKDNQRAAVCTWQGDVWIVSGLAQPNGKLTWRRVAAGMFQPLGVKIVDGTIYVCCRDQITRLHDTNGNGEMDFYENFNNDHQVTEHFHEFAMDLQTDAYGNFYYTKAARHAKTALVPQHGTLLKVSPEGEKTEIIASGFRAPNGVCVNPDGTFYVSDQEGHWTPKNEINLIEKGKFYGNLMGYHQGLTEADITSPMVWMHNDFDRSPAEQLWVNSNKWGGLGGQLINLSYGTGYVYVVMAEKVNGRSQGGVVRIPDFDFPTGVMRGRFHPGDGQLYACGLFGWAGNKTRPGGFYRLRHTGKPVHLPVAIHATRDGITLTFTHALDPETAADPESYSVYRWGYRRTRNYGSRDYKADGSQGRDRVEVQRVKLSKDKKSVLLQIADMKPTMQMQIRYKIDAADGTYLSHRIQNTIHAIGNNGPFARD